MTIDNEKLMAYADGELSQEERAEVERAVANDSALRSQLENHRRMRAELSGAYAGVMDEPVPEPLLTAARGAPREAEVVDLSARRAVRPQWSAREWGAMAASLAGGLIIGFGALRTEPSPIAIRSDGMSARGALERALNKQLASDDANAVRIGLSFRATDGDYCRTFELNAQDTAGIACRNEGGWNVAMTAAQNTQGEVRMAGASQAVLAAVDEMIDGDALDAEAEARARDAGWR